MPTYTITIAAIDPIPGYYGYASAALVGADYGAVSPTYSELQAAVWSPADDMGLVRFAGDVTPVTVSIDGIEGEGFYDGEQDATVASLPGAFSKTSGTATLAVNEVVIPPFEAAGVVKAPSVTATGTAVATFTGGGALAVSARATGSAEILAPFEGSGTVRVSAPTAIGTAAAIPFFSASGVMSVAAPSVAGTIPEIREASGVLSVQAPLVSGVFLAELSGAGEIRVSARLDAVGTMDRRRIPALLAAYEVLLLTQRDLSQVTVSFVNMLEATGDYGGPYDLRLRAMLEGLLVNGVSAARLDRASTLVATYTPTDPSP